MFIGREKELQILEKKIQSPVFEFGLIYGRRRIGKTRLLQEVVSRHGAIYYVANEMGLDYNLKQLSTAIADFYNEPFSFDSFEQIFRYLAQKSSSESVVFILDEFTYLIESNKELLSIFQNCIDQYLLGSNLKLILSGSHVGMIEDAISYKKPLYGRTTFKIKVKPFDYYDAAKFYPSMSTEDKVRLYSIFGGVPFYTSKIDDTKSVKDNVIELIIEEGAIFEDEISFFLSQEIRSVSTYGRILAAIAAGATRLGEITSKSGVMNTGNTSNHLNLLTTLGIIEKEICFGENENSKKSVYHIKDQLFHFHYTFIEKNKSQRVVMDPDVFYDTVVAPYLDEYVSFEFENICLEFLSRRYRNSLQEIGRYWYNDAKKRLDVEIDIVMRRDQALYAFECKWTKAVIDSRVARQLEERSAYLGNVQLGFFSRSGYDASLVNGNYELYVPEDLYNL